MASRQLESDIWSDSARELVAGWNPEGDEEKFESPPPSPPGASPGQEAPTPSDLEQDDLTPEDSFPVGPTVLYRAGAPLAPGSFSGVRSHDCASPDAAFRLSAPGSDNQEESAQADKEGRVPSGSLPRSGEELGGFRLVMELGRGAFARVFLAEELSLGHRLVALKVSRAEGDEPLILARLQHAHIVPVHSVHVDPVTGFRLLCMPFFGGANLAQLLRQAWGTAQVQATGWSLIQALDQFSERLPALVGPESSRSLVRSCRPRSRSRPVSGLGVVTAENQDVRADGRLLFPGRGTHSMGRLRGLMARLVSPRTLVLPSAEDDDEEKASPARQFLRGANGIQAAVWIVARLAEGLDHAHSRGLLHRDLKPANILIAADGTPMLLDFNLAAEAETEEDGASGGGRAHRAMLGGTLPYMSPEHLDALDPDGSTDPQEVDERSDLYALGLILFEMIVGEPPFAEPTTTLTPLETIRVMLEDRTRRPVPSLRARCPDVPCSLDALTSQCLDPDPDHRHRSAHELSEDLRRFLGNLPMKHCPEPSPRERLAKWARRHPTLSSSTSIVMVSLLLVTMLAGSVTYVYDSMMGLAARMKLRAFDHDFINSQFLLNVGSRDDELLKAGMRQAKQTLGQVPFLDVLSGGNNRRGPGHAVGFGSGANWIHRLTPQEARRVRRQALELLVLDARAGVILASHGGSREERDKALRRAVARLDVAEQIDAPLPSVLFRDRAGYHAALGDQEQAASDRARAALLAPSTSQDLTMLGTSLLASGDLAGAESALRGAITLDSTSLWAWFVRGHCFFEQGRYLEAAGDFSACVAIGPDYAWNHFNRGLAQARAGRPLDALVSYGRALALDPTLVEARVDRALVELELDRTGDALMDLRAAVAAGRRDLAVLSALGSTLGRTGRKEEAESLFRDLLDENSRDPVVLIARGMSRLESDFDGARRDFSEILDRDPRNAMGHYGMARLIRGHDHAAAVVHLDAALQADPHLVDAVQLRALERARLGDRGALDDVELLVKAPTALRLYNAACALAIYSETTGDPRSVDRAMKLLAQALDAGFPFRHAAADPDLRVVRSRPEFSRLRDRFRSPAEPAQR